MNTLKKVRPLYYISTASILYIREDIYNNSKKSDSKNTKEYTYKEIKSHNKEGDVWVTYKNGVYDVSNFINNYIIIRLLSFKFIIITNLPAHIHSIIRNNNNYNTYLYFFFIQ